MSHEHHPVDDCQNERVAPPSRGEVPADRLNPKDRVGAGKAPLSLFPPAGIIYGAMGLRDGADKYGPMNWRETPIHYRAYLDALMRHVLDLIDGEDCAEDSGIHHVGHIIATGAILADAIEGGWLIDDRVRPGPAPKALDRARLYIAGNPLPREPGTPPSATFMATPCPPRPALSRLIELSKEAVAKLAPAELAAMLEEQRQNFARGNVAVNRGTRSLATHPDAVATEKAA